MMAGSPRKDSIKRRRREWLNKLPPSGDLAPAAITFIAKIIGDIRDGVAVGASPEMRYARI